MKIRFLLVFSLVAFSLSCSLFTAFPKPGEPTSTSTPVGTPEETTWYFGNNTQIEVNDRFTLVNNSALRLNFESTVFQFSLAEFLNKVNDSDIQVEVILVPEKEFDATTEGLDQIQVEKVGDLYTVSIYVGSMVERLNENYSQSAVNYTILEINYDVITGLVEVGLAEGLYTEDEARKIRSWYINTQFTYVYVPFLMMQFSLGDNA